MYPSTVFGLYPPFPRENKVFVAMSFDSRFDKRWREAIAPGIRRVLVNEAPLEPTRVDIRKVSDSILTEILTGIANSRFIVADITTVGYLDGRPIRNGNVMYEVGIAQAVRLPEEVIIFRSDQDSLLFDTSNIRINHYSPDETPEEACSQITGAIISAGKELDLRRHLSVRMAAESLDFPCLWLLAQSHSGQGVAHPEMKTIRQVLSNTSRVASIARLLELGLLKTAYLEATPQLLEEIGDSPDIQIMKYEPTEFGNAVFEEGARRLGILSPEVQAYLEKKFQAENPGKT